MEAETKKVTINIKKMGSARPRQLQITPTIKVSDLRRLVGAEVNLPVERLKLFLHGAVLHDIKSGCEVHAKLNEGDSLLAVVAPKPPAKHIQDREADDEDDLRFKLPETAPQWEKNLVFLLQNKLRVPGIDVHLLSTTEIMLAFLVVTKECDRVTLLQLLWSVDILLMAIFSVSLKTWALIFLWFIMAPVAYRWDLGPIYVLTTAFSLIFFNLGQRRQGDASAYSIFNDGFRELPGTLNAERLDRDIRAGQF